MGLRRSKGGGDTRSFRGRKRSCIEVAAYFDMLQKKCKHDGETFINVKNGKTHCRICLAERPHDQAPQP